MVNAAGNCRVRTGRDGKCRAPRNAVCREWTPHVQTLVIVMQVSWRGRGDEHADSNRTDSLSQLIPQPQNAKGKEVTMSKLSTKGGSPRGWGRVQCLAL